MRFDPAGRQELEGIEANALECRAFAARAKMHVLIDDQKRRMLDACIALSTVHSTGQAFQRFGQ
ncbi:hypothetical protein H4S06_004841 [Coemansia sp. BCRC 34490]|nr:hypothetical protein H4S06_004841 [Coemansia sp. BCRC 34490]